MDMVFARCCLLIPGASFPGDVGGQVVCARGLNAVQGQNRIVTCASFLSRSSSKLLKRNGAFPSLGFHQSDGLSHSTTRCSVSTNEPSVAVQAPADSSVATARSEEELLRAIAREEEEHLPVAAADGLRLLYRNYKAAVEKSREKDVEGVVVKVMSAICDRIIFQFKDPFQFPSYHTRMLHPYDYYAFGQNYVRPVLDFKNSYVGNDDILFQIEEQLARGENVILLTNHQTEADPAILAHMLEANHPHLAEEMTYVAGDRVVLDPFVKPFSMGRNLICVYSKKHIADVPELMEYKMASNRRSIKEMAQLFAKGGLIMWIAPSGGRDRPDPKTKEWIPAAFDSSAVEMIRRLSEEAGPASHLYSMAMLCYDIMPPPVTLGKEIGERREVGFHGVGISVAPELSFTEITAGVEDRKEARDVFARAAWEAVNENYSVLFNAIKRGQGLSASVPSRVKLSQPWLSKVYPAEATASSA